MNIIFFMLLLIIGINLYGFGMMGWDKNRARQKKWRVPEKKIFLTALLGGAVGCYWGMRTFRHKTKHQTFTLGLPLCIIFNFLVVYPTFLFFDPLFWFRWFSI